MRPHHRMHVVEQADVLRPHLDLHAMPADVESLAAVMVTGLAEVIRSRARS